MMRFLSLVALAVLCPGFGFAQEKKAEAREDLRYDDKPFTYWEKFSLTELKSERRIDAVRAMAAFGTRGYAKEAPAVIVEPLKEYDNNEEAKLAFVAEKPTPDQRVLQEAARAFRMIGPGASTQVLAQLDHPAVNLVANQIYNYSANDDVAVSQESVPVLVGWVLSKNNTARETAIGILTSATHGEAGKAAFLATLAKEKSEKKMVWETRRERMWLIVALVKIAGKKEALPAVADLLDKNPIPEMEQELVQVYLTLDNDPKQVVNTLSKSLKRQSGAKKTVESPSPTLGSPSLAPASTPFPSFNTAYRAEPSFTGKLAAALGAQGEAAKSAVPLLLKAFDGGNAADKVAIVVALGKIGPAAGDAMPLLRRLLQADDADLRRAAAEAIEAITKK